MAHSEEPKKKRRLRFSIDNVDAKVDTSDGRNSFHATAMAVYQRQPSTAEAIDVVAQFITPTQNKSVSSLKDVPSTIVPIMQSTITGSPKPPTSPCYPDFKTGRNEDELRRAEVDDLAWLLVRQFHRDGDNAVNTLGPQCTDSRESEVTCEVPQPVPVWAAYNSLMRTSHSGVDDSQKLDKVHALPLINSPAHEWNTLTTALVQLNNLNQLTKSDDNNEPILVWLDMDLYKRVRKLSFLDLQFKDKIIACPGPFHIVLCALRCLGGTVESSGLDEAWIEAGLYSSVTVVQILNGKHHNRALDAHQISLQALFDLWIEAFFAENPTLHQQLMSTMSAVRKACSNGIDVAEAHRQLVASVNNLELKRQMEEFDQKNYKYPMYKWARMYMKQVSNLLQFLRGTRDRNWPLHLASLEKMCAYFFAFNRHDYAQNIPDHIAHMYQLETSHPQI